MLRVACLLLLFVAFGVLSPAAAQLTITAPSGLHIPPAAATAMTGISVSLVGANATTKYGITFDCTGCSLTATPSGNPVAPVTGSGTKSLAIGCSSVNPCVAGATAAPLNATIATLKVVWATAVLNASDIIHINAVSGGTNANQVPYALVVDGTKYLVHNTPAAALARSQQQCQALASPCDGVQTVYWWPVRTDLTNGQGAVQTIPGSAQFDKVCTTACPGGAASSGIGLSSGEQSSLVDVRQVPLPLPVAPPGS